MSSHSPLEPRGPAAQTPAGPQFRAARIRECLPVMVEIRHSRPTDTSSLKTWLSWKIHEVYECRLTDVAKGSLWRLLQADSR